MARTFLVPTVLLSSVNQGFQTILLADVVAGGEGVRRCQSKRRAEASGQASMISRRCSKRWSDALHLVPQCSPEEFSTRQNFKRRQANLRLPSARAYAVGFTSPARTAWMDNR